MAFNPLDRREPNEQELLNIVGSPDQQPSFGQQYFDLYPDVAQAFQQNNYGLSLEDFAKTHYDRFGVNEGRAYGRAPTSPAPVPTPSVTPPTTVFDQLEQAGLREDLAEPRIFAPAPVPAPAPAPAPQSLDDWGQQYRPTTYNESTGQIDYGSENFSSVPSGFNWQDYISKNPDLKQAGIDTEAEAKRHYVQFGAREDRQGAPAVSLQDAINFAKSNITQQNAFMDAGEAGLQGVGQGYGKYFINPEGSGGTLTGYSISGLSGKLDTALPFAPAGTAYDQIIRTDASGKVIGAQLDLKTGGDSGYYVDLDANGNITGIQNYDESESWRSPAALFASFLGATIGLPGIGEALSAGALSGASAAALGGAALGGANAAILGAEGSDILKSAAIGGAGGALSQGLGDKLAGKAGKAVAESLGDTAFSRAASDVVSGAVKGGLSSIPKAILTEDLGSVGIGALTGAGTKLAGGLMQEFAGSSPLGNLTERQVNAGINLIRNLDSGNTTALVNNLAELSGSKDAIVAVRAGTALNALASGNPNAMLAAVVQLGSMFGGQGTPATPRQPSGGGVPSELQGVWEGWDPSGGEGIPVNERVFVESTRAEPWAGEPFDLVNFLQEPQTKTPRVVVPGTRLAGEGEEPAVVTPAPAPTPGQSVPVIGTRESTSIGDQFLNELEKETVKPEKVEVVARKLPPDDITSQSVEVTDTKLPKPAPAPAPAPRPAPAPAPRPAPAPAPARQPTAAPVPQQEMSYITELPLYKSVFYEKMREQERKEELARALREQENADPYERLMELAERNPDTAVDELMKIVEGA